MMHLYDKNYARIELCVLSLSISLVLYLLYFLYNNHNHRLIIRTKSLVLFTHNLTITVI